MIDLGRITNKEVIQSLVDLSGKTVVDVGCGNMTFTRILVELGAQALAVDSDPVQARKNREAPVENIEFFEGCASQLPAPDKSVDGVFFSYSLHHVSECLFEPAISEVLRVLKPNGFLYVIEPIDCPLNQVMKLFHDEDAERAAAWKALHQLAVPRFQNCKVVTYHGIREFDSWNQFVNDFGNRSFNDGYTKAQVDTPEVRSAFEKSVGPNGTFTSPKNVMFLTEPFASEPFASE